MEHKLIEKILNHLSPDLLKKEYVDDNINNPLYGHCYVATETYYHLMSDSKSNYKPCVLKKDNINHWYLKNIKSNQIIDITKNQFDDEIDYNKGRFCSFLTKNPSKRSKILIERIVNDNRFKHLYFDDSIIVFIGFNECLSLDKNDLKKIKINYLKSYKNCYIYTYFDFKRKSIIKDRINKLKSINQIKIHARKCEIKVLSKEEKNTFLNSNHIQGSDNSPICYGAMFDNEIVSVMTFDPNKRVNGGLDENIYDLSRFSVKKGCIIVGIFNRLLNKFIKEYKPNKIISFGDLSYVNSSDNVYIKNNFKLVNTLASDFKYYHPEKDKLYHKLTYGRLYVKRNNLNDEEQKELYKKLIKVWDCGKLKYELYLDKNQKSIFGFIYKITNTINNKIYIGQTTRNLSSRISEYKKNSHNNNYLNNSFKKYGFEKFKFEIIDTAYSLIELNNKEIEYINKYDSTNKEIGYNIEIGGLNSIASFETREKMSESHIGVKQTQVWIGKRIAKSGSSEAKKYGKKKTEEEKKYLSEISPKYWKGKKRSDDTKNKISKTKKKNGLSKKQKDILCKKVLAYNPITNEKLNVFDSTSNAGKYYNISQSTISRRCSGKSKNSGDIYFKYL